MNWPINIFKKPLINSSYRRRPVSNALKPLDSGIRQNNRKRINQNFLKKALLSCLLLLIGLQVSAGQPGDAVIVVNPQVREESISLSTARTIFGMRLRTWGDGTPIKVYVLADDHPLHIDFSKQVLGMFPHQLRWAWDRLVFSGTGQAPIQVKTEDDMREMIENTPGAIGYLRRSQVDGNIHVLQIR